MGICVNIGWNGTVQKTGCKISDDFAIRRIGLVTVYADGRRATLIWICLLLIVLLTVRFLTGRTIKPAINVELA